MNCPFWGPLVKRNAWALQEDLQYLENFSTGFEAFKQVIFSLNNSQIISLPLQSYYPSLTQIGANPPYNEYAWVFLHFI